MMDTPLGKPKSQLRFLPLLVGILAIALALSFWLKPAPIPNIDPNDKPIARREEKLTSDDALKLVDLRNQAIGYLENHDFPKADAALMQILMLVPNDPFSSRNLLICRQLALQALDKNQYPAEFTNAKTAVQLAITHAKLAEPKSHIPFTLAARVANRLDNTDQALVDLREAVRLDPQAVGPAFDLYVLLQTINHEGDNDERIELLRKVYQREPNNLFVLKEWLPLMAQQHGPDFVETLQQARKTIEPFIESIKINSRYNVGEILDAAIVAAKDQKWPAAQRSVTTFKNLILSESARDSRYVALDSLEYVLPDFDQETLSNLNLPTLHRATSQTVHFLPPDDLTKWPKAAGCREIAVTDFNLDDRQDLIALNDNQLSAWGRLADDQAWTTLAATNTDGVYRGLLVYDFDDDIDQELANRIAAQKAENAAKHDPAAVSMCHTADPDVILFGPLGLKLFENQKDRTNGSRSLVAKSGGAAFDGVRDVITAAVADLDADGDLDLAISTAAGLRLFSNRGNLTFDEISGFSILPPGDAAISAISIADWDRDTNVDLLIATSHGGGWLENLRHGRFRYRELDETSLLRACHMLNVGDLDGNGSWDIVTAGPNGAHVLFTDRTADGLVSVRNPIALTASPVRVTQIGDFDNDAGLDVLILKNDGATIYRGHDSASFSPNPKVIDDWLKHARTLTVEDLDRDGDLDLVIADEGGLMAYSSQCRETDNPGNGWLEVRLVAERVQPNEQNWNKRVNHINLGGILEVKSGRRYQAKTVTGNVSHFGLGVDRHADVARIFWTNGIPTNVLDPAADATVCIEQKLGGSCPYLYTWNGEQFEFVTDLLWNAPLGLKFAETVIAPWREWEYLKIEGRQLRPRDHEYQLRVTAELWEAEYFDQIKLFAIDHPVGTDIYTNEKVGPAEIATPKIHTVRSPRKPVAARDTKGRDVLNQVMARDGNYTKTFDKLIAQGFAEEHFLELDLGKFPAAKQVMLYLTGWMYPGSTSLRVALAQNPDLPPSRPPAIFAPDATGEWREVRSYMGFPGGKNKTIAVDVSDLFTNNDHRLRIVSTLELFWDDVFFTVDDQPVEFRETELKLVRAELRDRGGVSARSWPATGHGPDQFHYAQVIPGEAWPPMSGNFTRLGDVLPLLTQRDDHLVISGSGDEIRLAFAEPATPVPENFVRDFVIYTVGWDKDADPNTVYGNTVEPLPFEAMTVYAHRDGEPRPVDAAYESYLKEYQTRKRSPSAFWKGIQRWKREQ